MKTREEISEIRQMAVSDGWSGKMCRLLWEEQAALEAAMSGNSERGALIPDGYKATRTRTSDGWSAPRTILGWARWLAGIRRRIEVAIKAPKAEEAAVIADEVSAEIGSAEGWAKRSGWYIPYSELYFTHAPGLSIHCWATWFTDGWIPEWGKPETGWDPVGCRYVYGANFTHPCTNRRHGAAARLFGAGEKTPGADEGSTSSYGLGVSRLIYEMARSNISDVRLHVWYCRAKVAEGRLASRVTRLKKARQWLSKKRDERWSRLSAEANEAERRLRKAEEMQSRFRSLMAKPVGDPMTPYARTTVRRISESRGHGSMPAGLGQWIELPNHGEFDGEYWKYSYSDGVWIYTSGTGNTTVYVYQDGSWAGKWSSPEGETYSAIRNMGEWVEPWGKVAPWSKEPFVDEEMESWAEAQIESSSHKAMRY